MLICNNCEATNPDGTQQCQVCKMPDNFRYFGSKIEEIHLQEQSISPNMCINCGHSLAVKEELCTHCHFPAHNPLVKAAPKRKQYQKELDDEIIIKPRISPSTSDDIPTEEIPKIINLKFG